MTTTPPNELGFRRVIGLASLIIALAACNGTDPGASAVTSTPSVSLPASTSSAPPATTPSAIVASDDARSASRKSLAIYRSMWTAYEKALSIPDPAYPPLEQAATGDALAILVKAIQSAKDKGLKGTGGAKFTPEVVEISPAKQPVKVTIRDCLDSSNSHLVKATPGGTPYKDEPGGRRLTIAIVERHSDGLWKVTSVGTRDVGTC